jgi:MYXO-CTERM domain-containing protein
MSTSGLARAASLALGRALISILVVASVLTGVSAARAGGTVTIKSLQPEESDGKWKLNMTINYGSMPNLPHVPMIFSFEMTTLYERALEDKTGDKPVLLRKPLSNQSPINESMDVGFSDPTGKIFTTTKFDFVIRRDRGFEAGEYTLKIKREGDGVPVGTPQKITLKGDNPVVDRRAIVFSGEKKKKDKSEDDKGSGDKEKKDDGKKETAKNEGGEGETKEASTPSETPPEEPSAPPPVPPKQGGCGCRVGGAEGTPSGAGAAALAALALAALARRRKAA